MRPLLHLPPMPECRCSLSPQPHTAPNRRRWLEKLVRFCGGTYPRGHISPPISLSLLCAATGRDPSRRRWRSSSRRCLPQSFAVGWRSRCLLRLPQSLPVPSSNPIKIHHLSSATAHSLFVAIFTRHRRRRRTTCYQRRRPPECLRRRSQLERDRSSLVSWRSCSNGLEVGVGGGLGEVTAGGVYPSAWSCRQWGRWPVCMAARWLARDGVGCHGLRHWRRRMGWPWLHFLGRFMVRILETTNASPLRSSTTNASSALTDPPPARASRTASTPMRHEST